MCLNRKIVLFPIVLFLSISALYAQKSKSQLEKEKKENLAKIEAAQKILSETENRKQASLGQLRALNQKIKAHRAVISSISEELKLLETDISDLGIVTAALQTDLENLKKEYAEMIYASYKANWGHSKLTFLFSSKTFNQLSRRLKYLEQYSEARKTQVKEIEIVSQQLNKQRKVVSTKKEEKGKLLESQVKQNKDLISLKNRQGQLITKLSSREQQLKKELNERKQAIRKLDNLIASIVNKELGISTSSSVVSSATMMSFEQSKKKLNWPVDEGFVSMKFGKHPHPVLRGQYEENMGVNIQTSRDENVKAVFDGEVSVVAYIPGMNYVVIVKHGDYFTTYNNLKSKTVKKGQKVKANQTIGQVFTDSQGVSELQFMIWRNKEKLDPELWLSPR